MFTQSIQLFAKLNIPLGVELWGKIIRHVNYEQKYAIKQYFVR